MTDEELEILKKQTSAAKKEFNLLDLKLKAELLRRAEDACDFKIGDEVKEFGGRLMCITRVTLGYDGHPRLHAKTILRGGDLGKIEYTIYRDIKYAGHRQVEAGEKSR